MPTFATYTLGCKVSQYESTVLSEELIKLGMREVDFGDFADVYVINTCTVTAESDAKSRKYIRRALRKNPDAVVAVMGCYSQRSPEEVAAIPGVSIVAGTADKMKLPKMIAEMLSKAPSSVGEAGPLVVDKVLSDGSDKTMRSGHNLRDIPSQKDKRHPTIMTKSLSDEKFEPMCLTKPERTRAYVKIEDGCECRCTYCAIADARGPVRSKAPEDVIREVEGLYANGTREIVLTGIETGSYGADFSEKYDLGDLIAELDSRGSCERIRLGSLAPELIGEKFIDKVKNTRILAPHFHLSMQSGSDAVLRGMKRRYNRDMVLRNMEIIRRAFPSVTFTTDMMVGFPGESEEDFLLTIDFVKRARFLDCHVFAYSKRAGTPAAEYKNQVPEAEKKRRSEILIKEKNLVRDCVLDEICRRGEPLSCIFETREGNEWTAHSDTFAEVRVISTEELSGRLINVIPKYAKGGMIFGELIPEE